MIAEFGYMAGFADSFFGFFSLDFDNIAGTEPVLGSLGIVRHPHPRKGKKKR